MSHLPHTFRNRGFTILISVLVIGAVALSVGVSLMFFGTKSLQTTEALQYSARASALAQACIEDALEHIRETGGQTTSGNLTIAGDSCTYTIQNQGGESRRIESVATVNGSTRRVIVTITGFSDEFVFASWEER